jgi:DNA-binding MarR family transcriptional regulator
MTLVDRWHEESIGFLIGHTYRKMVQHVTLHLREFDLTPEQFAVLFRLSKQDGINQKELAQRTAKDQPTITRILDALSKKGMIEKKSSDTDRRAFLITLSAKGWEWMDLAVPAEAKAISEVFEGIRPEQMDQLKQILLQMNTNINRHSKD